MASMASAREGSLDRLSALTRVGSLRERFRTQSHHAVSLDSEASAENTPKVKGLVNR
jgi:hypothetical protein